MAKQPLTSSQLPRWRVAGNLDPHTRRVHADCGAGGDGAGHRTFRHLPDWPHSAAYGRGVAIAWEAASQRGRVALAAAALLGWPLLADFHAHYFRFVEQSGGQAHLTFRTGAVEPKQAALQYILDSAKEAGTAAEAEGRREKGELWIVCSEWWNRWPIRYLALPQPAFCVVEPREADSCAKSLENNKLPDFNVVGTLRVPCFVDGTRSVPTTISVTNSFTRPNFRRALAKGRVWFVEFCGSDAERLVQQKLAGRRVIRQEFCDYGGRPVLCVLHAGE